MFRATRKHRTTSHLYAHPSAMRSIKLSFPKQKAFFFFLTDKVACTVRRYRTPTSWPLQFSSKKKEAFISPIMTTANHLNHSATEKHCEA